MMQTDIEDNLIEGTVLYSMEPPKFQKMGNYNLNKKVHNLDALELKQQIEENNKKILKLTKITEGIMEMRTNGF